MNLTKKIDINNPNTLIHYIVFITFFLLLLLSTLNMLKINVVEIETYNSNFKKELLYQNKIGSINTITIIKTNLNTNKEYNSRYVIENNFFLKVSMNSKIYKKRIEINDIAILSNYPLETYSSVTIKTKNKSLLEYIFRDGELLVKN